MKKIPDRIDVPVPPPEASRDGVERRVFEALARRDREDGRAPSRARGRMIWALGLGTVAVVTLFALRITTRREAPVAPGVPSTVATGPGQGTRLVIGDAIIDVGENTKVGVLATNEETVLDLRGGSVDCDVPPRPGRPGFRVLAGAVSVEVLATRFAVRSADGRVQVEVARGRVRVATATGSETVAAGASWSSDAVARDRPPAWTAGAPATAAAPPPTVSPGGDDLASAAPPRAEPPAADQPAAAFVRAQRLEPAEPHRAADIYAALSRRRDVWGALALYGLAELEHRRGRHSEALALAEEYARRFPRGANAQEIAWLRVEVLAAAGRREDARGAAAAYLARYPQGVFATPARRIGDASASE